MWEAVYNSNASDDGLDCMAFCTIDITIEGITKNMQSILFQYINILCGFNFFLRSIQFKNHFIPF